MTKACRNTLLGLSLLAWLAGCTPVSPYLLPPGGIKVGDSKASVENVLGRPEEDMHWNGMHYYIYKKLQWVEKSDRNIYETLFWIMEFDLEGNVTKIETLQGSFFSVTSRDARQWVWQRAFEKTHKEPAIE
ncbi:MAG: hypothetical protein GTO40_02200 [Deltaproteobacteria bacterium]|nr:hypothetical protein [Deltaproteobacteria bacterium]